MLAACAAVPASHSPGPIVVPSTAPLRSSAPSATPIGVSPRPIPTPRPVQTPGPTPQTTAAMPDPALWTRTGDLLEARDSHAAALLMDGRVLVAGGRKLDPTPFEGVRSRILDSVELYDVATGRWTAGPPMQRAREDHDAVTLLDGRVLVVGGNTVRFDGSNNIAVNVKSAEVFDPVTGRWTLHRSPTATLTWATATLLRDGRVLIIGWSGKDYPNEQVITFFDPATDAWTVEPSSKLVRALHATQLLADGRVLVVGGTGLGGHVASPLDDAAIYDPVAGTWTDVGPMRAAGYNMRTDLLPDGRVLVEFGVSQVFDPAARTWTHGGAVPDEDELEATVALSDGRIIGFPDPGRFVEATGLTYDPDAQDWVVLGSFRAVSRMTLTLLTDDRVLVAGGYVGCYRSNPCAGGEVGESWLIDLPPP